ncbi:endonuclease/exonuclease/phosphatase family protein [Streptomyces sp. NPDC018031]|uniref:endonuclease/exonuclease/phosphatase family protein n=1 Tax=Streptomyces sp. NPDC018031 TaxID=3365033 RepID=UPI0037B771EF
MSGAGRPEPGGGRAPGTLRVLTWNVWWLFGAWRERREAIAAVLREVRPDVIGLQEVWGRDGETLAGELAARLAPGGWHWTWAASDAPDRWRRRIDEPPADVGNAVLSRWPIVGREVLRLPVAGGRDDGRLALHAMIDAPGARVPFFTAHLNSVPHESAVRCAQVTELAGFVAAHSSDTDFPPVVTGDFNARPESDELRLFGGHLTAPAVPGLVMVDAWAYADPGAPELTWDRANPHVAASLEPSARIDYIHVGLPGPGGAGSVRAVRRTGDAPVAGVWPSDHAAVVADLALRPPDGPADAP